MPKSSVLLVAAFGLVTLHDASAEDCANMKGPRKGIATISNALPGDWAKVALKCGNVVLATCTATVAAGQQKATCNFPATALTKGTYDCATSNSPRKGSAAGGTCMAP